MSVRSALKKMFDNSKESYDEYGQPVQKETMEEMLLRKHLEREHKKKVKNMLKHYERKHWKEMTSIQMPYHKVARRKKRR